MTRKASVVVEKDEDGFYVWCPEGCRSQGDTAPEERGPHFSKETVITTL